MRNSLGFGIGFGIFCIGVACSAGKVGKSNVGSGGSAASGGDFTLGGNSGTGTGGAAASSGTFTMNGGGPPHDAGMDAAIDAGPCATLDVQTQEIVPTVALLVDTSGSMFEGQHPFWDPLYHALMDTGQVVDQLQDKIRFGFSSYKGFTLNNVETCPSLINVPYAMHNHDAINAVYGAIAGTYHMGANAGVNWETPTHAAIDGTVADLAAFTPDPPGPKSILLVTDGVPDTCWTVNPQCGQDYAVKAAQDAYAKGIPTYVLGVGDLASGSDLCDPGSARCGLNALQDMANAGAGQPVEPMTGQVLLNYTYSQCVANSPTKAMTGSYAQPGGGGMAPYYTVAGSGTASDITPLVNTLKQALFQTRSCSFALTATPMDGGAKIGVHITTNAEKGSFALSGTPLGYMDPNGWSLTSDQNGITLSGTACDTWKTSGGTLTGQFPCDVTFDPIPPPPPPK